YVSVNVRLRTRTSNDLLLNWTASTEPASRVKPSKRIEFARGSIFCKLTEALLFSTGLKPGAGRSVRLLSTTKSSPMGMFVATSTTSPAVAEEIHACSVVPHAALG